MRLDEYQRMYELESSYWWHQGRRRIIELLLKKHIPKSSKPVQILDLGCGTGINFEILQKFGIVKGIDSSPAALEFCKKRGFANVELADVEKLELPDNTYDLVTAFDLLEHLGNDEAVLRRIYRILKPGGLVFILAPAYQFLWSGHDEALHHKRRYLLSEMHRKLSRAGFQMKKRSYCITFLSLPMVLYRLVTSFGANRRPATSYVILPKWLNSFFISLLHLEAYLLKKFNFPFGISILCLAKK
ncbi:MAG: methyltransferase domain-containing protein [Patescibacteria group bacterium]|nr:methyltransferase domain-containing protein [Patescibacteria group bacterium]